MDDEIIQRLNSKTDLLVQKYQQLLRENQQLRADKTELEQQCDTLQRKNRLASQKIQAVVHKLRANQEETTHA
ncbi:MAG: hypothetical protein CMF50_02105 [Legionellales bacterium]|nr:hypothetical protein [Legionellales bacterium]|tara:strand:+ start:59371 stop:59589 length:219 start_codon:yes stop_codon:yes gene_type:complete